VAKGPKTLFNSRSSVKVVVDPAGVDAFVTNNPAVRNLLMQTGYNVAAEANSTASDAEQGPSGRISGYASAGFSVEFQVRPGARPRVNVKSNAPGDIALAAHFSSQRRNGVGHLRAALYRFTSRG
jgi:hypothetical protein